MKIPSSEIGKAKLSPALYNGAGTIKKLEEVKEAARCESAGAILVGSITMEERTGNAGQVLWVGPYGSLNSLGIPNGGIPYYRQYLPEMVRVAHDAGKPLFVSVAGFKPEEFGRLAGVAAEGGADGVELNFGCPNIWDSGGQKRIFSFYPELVSEALDSIWEHIDYSLAWIVKVSPFSNPMQLKEVAKAISGWSVNAVVTSNTFPNAYGEDEDGRPLITPGAGLAGFAGPGFKYIALGQAKQWRQALPPSIGVVGVGGINSGRDIAEYFRCKVVAVQVVSALLRKHHLDLHVLDRLLLEFDELPEEEPETAA